MATKKIISIAVITVFGMISLFWGVVQGQSFRTGSTTTVAADETVNSSLWVSGRTIDIAGQVNGDVFCAGQNVTVSGTVRGDLLCASQTIVVSGTVTGDVRSLAQTATVSGAVLHNLSAASQSFSQGSKSNIRGDISVAANDILMNGTVGRDAALAAQTITLGGKIGRNVTSTVADLQLSRGARIDGNLHYTSEKNVQLASGASVGGKTTKSLPVEDQKDGGMPSAAGFGFGFFFYALAAGLLISLALVLLLPQAIHAVTSQAVRSPGKTLLVGLLAFILVPASVIILMLTIIGIPLALLLIVAWVLVQALAGVVSAYYLGRMVWRGQRNPILIMLAGSILLIVLYFIPIIGFIAMVAAMLLGTGMILLTLARLRPRPDYRLE